MVGRVTYRLQRRPEEGPLEWEVVRVEDDDVVYAEARFARREDAEAFLSQLKRFEVKE